MKATLSRSVLLLGVATILVGTAYPVRDQAASARAENGVTTTGLVTSTARFVLHSSPLINLHHFLYHWSANAAEEIPEASGLDALSAQDRRIWDQTLAFYTQHVVAYDLLFSREMRRAKYLLLQLDEGYDPVPADFPFGLDSVLAEVMPVYENHWWPEYDSINRAWIGLVAPELEQYEDGVATRLAHAYGGEWPAERVRIDISAYANWAGAYTTPRPDQITISSRTLDGADLLALETVFHEVSHSGSLEQPFRDAVRRAYEELGAEPPERLWHALVFYTAGELTREVLRAHGIENYETYAERRGFFDRDAWAGYRHTFDSHWKPHLDGRIDRSLALHRIAQELPR